MSAKTSRLPQICAVYGPRFAKDLGYSRAKVAGLLGNGDVESAGYNTLQETHPVVEGSAGGFGWMQWTGYGKYGRRGAYEKWCQDNGLDKYADETNYRYTVYELLHIETAAHRAILACADTPEAAAAVVCTKYLRPGTPHLDRRIASAKQAYGYLGSIPTGPVALPPVLQQPAPAPVVVADDNQVGVHPAVEIPAAQVGAGHWPEDELSKFEIEAVQNRLLALGYHIVGFADGKWGKRTAAALQALQTQAGITPDGHYGPQTRAALASDASKATVAPERANVTAKVLAKLGNPSVKAGQKITLASVGSILAGAGALAGTLSSGWTTELPWPLSMVSAFLPPPVMIGLVVAFNLYNAAKATGLIGSAVARVQQGIDNTGAPAPDAPTFQLPTLPFGLDKLLPR